MESGSTVAQCVRAGCEYLQLHLPLSVGTEACDPDAGGCWYRQFGCIIQSVQSHQSGCPLWVFVGILCLYVGIR